MPACLLPFIYSNRTLTQNHKNNLKWTPIMLRHCGIRKPLNFIRLFACHTKGSYCWNIKTYVEGVLNIIKRKITVKLQNFYFTSNKNHESGCF